MEDEKGILRKKIHAQRAVLDEDMWKSSSRKIVDRYCELDSYRQADVILAYITTGKEVELLSLAERCETDDRPIAVPRVLTGVKNGAQMEFVFIKRGMELKENALHIPEPVGGTVFVPEDWKGKRIEMILPGMCFDLCGNRIGYGGGYYDRYLEQMKDIKIHKSALAFDFQILNRLPSMEYDMGYDMLVTEKRYYII